MCSAIETKEKATSYRQKLTDCEQQKMTNEIIAIAAGVALGAVLLSMLGTIGVAYCCHKQSVKQNNFTLEDQNIELNDLKEANDNLSKENNDLKQESKDKSIFHEVDTIITIAEENKGHYSNNPEIQKLLEKFVERANKVIKIVGAGTMDGGDGQVKYDGGDVERIQKIKEVMESVNGQLDAIIL